MSSADGTSLRQRNVNAGGPHRRLLLCEVEPLHHKSVAQEIRGSKDLQRIADTAPILLNVPATTPDRLVGTMLSALVEAGSLPPAALAEATAALVGHQSHLNAPRDADNAEDAFDTSVHASSSALPISKDDIDPEISHDDDVAIEAPVTAHWHRNILGAGFLIPFARIAGLNASDRSVVAIARLTSSANLGVANDSMVRFVIVVLGPMRDIKETKSPFEIARTLSSLFQDDDFVLSSRRCDTEDDFREEIRKYITRQTEPASDETDHESGVDKTFERTGKFAGGFIADIKRRLNPSTYLSDWTDGLRDGRSLMKYLSTTVWLYFAIIMPTIAFGALDDKNTNGSIGFTETLLSQAFAGITFAVFAGQPLTIVMTTAPLTVFIDVLYRWCVSLEIEFLPFYAWTGIWTAVILIILVVTDACYIMKYCGHFTEEIFATLIAALFVSEYIKPLIHVRQDESTEVFLLAFLLATGTFLIAVSLLNFRRSFLLKPVIRDLLSDFGVPIAIITMAAARQAFPNIDVSPLNVPEEIGLTTTNGRSWVVPLFDIKVQHIFLALVSGALLATLFFLDQNISSMLVNRFENKLKKGPGYYLDLVVVSVIIVVQSIFGMPWTHAALPHSPLHARQLADVQEYEEHGRRYERVVKSRETRVTGLLSHVLIGVSILAKDVLEFIPLAVLYGFFLFLGLGALDGNAFWERILLLFTQPEKYPPNHYVRRVKIQRIHLYTLIQIILLVVLWFVKSNFYMGDTVFNTGLLFPFVIALFIPVRLYLLPRIFRPAELHALSMEEGENVSDTGITV